MQVILDMLIKNPVLLLLVVLAVGHIVGSLRLGSFSLGLSAVLFTGLVFGSLHPDLKLPEVIQVFGLSLFVYTIGISSGPGFVATFRSKGWRDSLLVLGMMVLAGVILTSLALLLHLKPAQIAGVFCGSLTNTPALAGLLEYIKIHFTGPSAELLSVDPVVGFSLAYPAGILGSMTMMWLFQKIWKINHEQEAHKVTGQNKIHPNLTHYTVQITQKDMVGRTIREIFKKYHWEVVFGRIKHENKLGLVAADTVLHLGDRVTLVGSRQALDKVVPLLGKMCVDDLQTDRSEIDYRRLFVSNHKIIGKKIKDLKILEHFGAIITRLRRGDVEIVPNSQTVLELGDRVRVITYREKMKDLAKYFGDSYKAVSENDILSLSIGLALGIIVGLIPIPLPGGVTFKLGFAGGPLTVALILGAIGRTRGIVWGIPYSANMSLRQLGILMFMAGVGTRSGYAFGKALMQGHALTLIALAFVVSLLVTTLTLWVGYKLMKLSYGYLMGLTAGMFTQPAILSFATEQAKNETPNLGYASSYPMAMISKIVIAQIILTVLLK